MDDTGRHVDRVNLQVGWGTEVLTYLAGGELPDLRQEQHQIVLLETQAPMWHIPNDWELKPEVYQWHIPFCTPDDGTQEGI